MSNARGFGRRGKNKSILCPDQQAVNSCILRRGGTGKWEESGKYWENDRGSVSHMSAHDLSFWYQTRSSHELDLTLYFLAFCLIFSHLRLRVWRMQGLEWRLTFPRVTPLWARIRVCSDLDLKLIAARSPRLAPDGCRPGRGKSPQSLVSKNLRMSRSLYTLDRCQCDEIGPVWHGTGPGDSDQCHPCPDVRQGQSLGPYLHIPPGQRQSSNLRPANDAGCREVHKDTNELVTCRQFQIRFLMFEMILVIPG